MATSALARLLVALKDSLAKDFCCDASRVCQTFKEFAGEESTGQGPQVSTGLSRRRKWPTSTTAGAACAACATPRAST